MKFGYRDRIILLIACVVIIFGIGIFVFIKPKYEDMQADKKARDDAENTWNAQLLEFDGIEAKQKYIQDRYQDALKMADNFTPEMDATELDQFFQEKFFNNPNLDYKKNGTKLDASLSVTDEGSSTIGFYYYTPSILTYPLYEYADLDGSLAKAAQEKLEYSDMVSARQAQTAGSGTASFTLYINKKDAFDFIDGIHKYAEDNKDTMIINSVSFSDYDFNGPALERNDDGEITGERPENLPEKYDAFSDEELGYTDVSVSYTVYYMQEPTQPDVGEKYDKTVWDGDEWRNFKLEENAQ